MSAFEEALKRTVLGLGAAYDATRDDLTEVVTGAADAVERLTEGLATLNLDETDEDDERVIYGLYVGEQTTKNWHEIGFFAIPSTGYPIKVAASESMLKRGSVELVLRTKEDITNYFEKMASNPNSKLALRLAFIMRTGSEDDETTG